MSDAPKEIWVDYGPYVEGYAEISETENSDTKYIRADIAEEWHTAAKNLMEDCESAYFRIEQLEAENAKLRSALARLVELDDMPTTAQMEQDEIDQARKALAAAQENDG